MIKWFILLILISVPVSVLAEITFSWTLYEDPIATHIRMYKDGGGTNNIEIEEISKEDTTASVPSPTDGNNHAYYIVGIVKDAQGNITKMSEPSGIATWCAKCPPCIQQVKEIIIPPIVNNE